MKLDVPLDHPGARITAIAALIGLCGALLYVTLCDFLVGALTDERIGVTVAAPAAAFVIAPFRDDRVGINPDVLTAVARRFPSSPRLHMKLAQYERYHAK